MRIVLREGYRLVRRDQRSRELRILALSLIVAVATVTAITVFSAKLQQIIFQSSSQFLAGDRQLSSPQPVEETWLAEARVRGIEVARVLEFASMLFSDESMQLVSVKAVTSNYPLKGALEVSASPRGEIRATTEAPPPGTIWIAPRLFSLLDLEIGGSAAVGDQSFQITQVVQREPDTSFSFMNLSPRVLMNWDDVEATGVVQPGSRLTYRYIFAGSPEQLAGYESWLSPKLGPSHNWQDVRSGRPALADAMEKAETYLLLGGSLAVILAGVAIAMSARQYAQRQYDTVALLKTLGVRGRAVTRFYGVSFLVLGLICAGIGLLLGWLGHLAILWVLRELIPPLPVETPLSSLGVGFATALISLLAFAMPPLLMLQKVSPARVLRRDMQEQGRGAFWLYGIGVLAIVAILYLYSGNLMLTLLMVGGLFAVVLVFVGLAALFLRAGRLAGTRASSFWRLGLAAVARRRWQSILQMVVFALALMLLLVIYLTRTSLVSEWQAQLPADAPNHFLINIAPADMPVLEGYLDQQDVPTAGLYPIVRGRLSHINGEPARRAVSKDEEVNALNRELNMTWMDVPPSDNRIVEGEWWPQGSAMEPWVSVEAKLAERLELNVGDLLTFTIGDRRVDVTVKNLRTVEWDSMKPNFYIVFMPGFLEEFPTTYITSMYLRPDQKGLLNELTSRFPTVTILELDQLIERVRGVMTQVSVAIEMVLALILLSALLVVAALVNVTMGERYHEGALLRALGASRRLIAGGIFVEFAVLGGLAGLVAVIGAEVTVWAIQAQVLEIQARAHPGVWFLAPLLGALLVGGLGYLQSLRVVRVSPIEAIRQAE